MKYKLAVLCILIPLASYAQSNQVVSRNAVGYVRVDLQKGEIRLLSYPFFCLSTNDYTPPTPMNTMFFDTVPPGTCLYVWDAAASMYRSEILVSNRVSGLKWIPNKNLLSPGRGFWMKIHPMAPSNYYTIYLLGEVPDDYTAPTSTVDILPGMNLLGYPYPAETQWTNLNLAKTATPGDIIYTFSNGAYQSSACYMTTNGTCWSQNLCLRPGDGFWFKRTAGTALTWEETKPYTWP